MTVLPLVSEPATGRVADPSASREALLAGARAMLPWLVAIVPYGLVIGVTVGASAIAPSVGLATGPAIFSGSAQLAAIKLIEEGATPLVAVAAILAINVRLAFYSGGMAARWRGTTRRFRVLASYLLVDPSYAVGTEAYNRPSPNRPMHYLGGALVLWVAWQAAMVVGFVAGAGMPAGLNLQYAVPLFLVAEVVKKADRAATVAAAVVGGVVALVADTSLAHGGPPLGIGAGIAVACLVDRWLR